MSELPDPTQVNPDLFAAGADEATLSEEEQDASAEEAGAPEDEQEAEATPDASEEPEQGEEPGPDGFDWDSIDLRDPDTMPPPLRAKYKDLEKGATWAHQDMRKAEREAKERAERAAAMEERYNKLIDALTSGKLPQGEQAAAPEEQDPEPEILITGTPEEIQRSIREHGAWVKRQAIAPLQKELQELREWRQKSAVDSVVNEIRSREDFEPAVDAEMDRLIKEDPQLWTEDVLTKPNGINLLYKHAVANVKLHNKQAATAKKKQSAPARSVPRPGSTKAASNAEAKRAKMGFRERLERTLEEAGYT